MPPPVEKERGPRRDLVRRPTPPKTSDEGYTGRRALERDRRILAARLSIPESEIGDGQERPDRATEFNLWLARRRAARRGAA